MLKLKCNFYRTVSCRSRKKIAFRFSTQLLLIFVCFFPGVFLPLAASSRELSVIEKLIFRINFYIYMN
ncbi:hypothetical protein TNCT_350271 [Trichonephila clavata]|uniref:Uncharacterized protein n=1 Tax=Trichonephila clavata TaxID=2740835 RepID=A0A8X6FF23_TRICU|nr:hypothetical protein TNCT_350271 [Trichonephila clavata]